MRIKQKKLKLSALHGCRTRRCTNVTVIKLISGFAIARIIFPFLSAAYLGLWQHQSGTRFEGGGVFTGPFQLNFENS